MDSKRTIDRLVAGALRANAHGEACPDASVTAAYLDRTLSAVEVQELEAHFARCGRCQEQLALITAAEPEAPELRVAPAAAPRRDASTAWRGSRWWIPLSAAAVAVLAVWSAVEREPVPTAPEAVVAESESPVELAQEAREAPEGAAAPARPLEAPSAASPPVGDAADERAAPRMRMQIEAEPADRPAAPDRAVADADVPREQAPAVAALAAGAAAALEADAAIEMAAPGGTVRWRLRAAGVIERSDDGGESWRVQHEAGVRLLAGAAPSARAGWVVGESGTVLRTADGERWTPTSRPTSANLIGIDADDGLQATVEAADGTRFITTDGGLSWQRP